MNLLVDGIQVLLRALFELRLSFFSATLEVFELVGHLVDESAQLRNPLVFVLAFGGYLVEVLLGIRAFLLVLLCALRQRCEFRLGCRRCLIQGGDLGFEPLDQIALGSCFHSQIENQAPKSLTVPLQKSVLQHSLQDQATSAIKRQIAFAEISDYIE